MVLETYRAKRDFASTPEPRGKAKAAPGAGERFCVQKHAARRLHYDFRLELDGVLKSWAVAKGPSLVAGEKRLAVHTEDHPLDYGAFEGTIPKGQYGGGTVLLWDRGRWIPEEDPRKGYAKGHLRFRLEGEKLAGSWHLVRMKPKKGEKQEPWLLMKSEDEAARSPEDPDILEEKPLSVASGRSIEEIAADPERIWSSKPVEAEPKAESPKARARRAVAKPAPAVAASPVEAAAVPGASKSGPPAFIEPSLAALAASAPAGERWVHEIKFDGYRIQAHVERGKAVLYTRSGLDWTHRFRGVAEALSGLPAGAAVLDGELVVESEGGLSDFAALREDLEAGRSERMRYYAFDLLYLEGFDLRPSPLEQRKRALKALLEGVPAEQIRYSEHLETDGEAMVRHACRLGLEGIVSKQRDLPYRSGRRGDWLKIKCTERQEFVVAGYVPSTASPRAVGSLVLGYYEDGALVHAGRVGTGFTQAQSAALWKRLDGLKAEKPPFARRLTADAARGARWARPDLVAEVEFRGWTPDGLLRHAAFRGLREDKEAAEVVRERARAQTPAKDEEPRAARAAAASASTRGASVAGVTLTHPDRVLWEGQGLTKQGLAEFYEEIAPYVLPHVTGRPLSLVRCPSGAEKQCFYQKHSWAGVHEAVRRAALPGDGGEAEEVLVIDDLAGLIALVQAGVLEIHPWGSSIEKVEQPDRIIFDLDPGEGLGFEAIIEGAREVRERLLAFKLESFVKTSGGKGLHVVAPLTPSLGWDEVKTFTRELAEAMEADNRGRYLSTMSKKARAGRIFVDYLRNGRGATAVAVYSTRARAGAPVSTPLGWDELSPAILPNHYTVANLRRRLRTLASDPWGEFFKIKQKIGRKRRQP